MPNTPLHNLILSTVPTDGTPIGNIALHSLLQRTLPDLTMDEYATAREELVAQGLLRKGRGRGGSVCLVGAVASGGSGFEVSEVDVWEESEMERDLAQVGGRDEMVAEGGGGEQSGGRSGRTGDGIGEAKVDPSVAPSGSPDSNASDEFTLKPRKAPPPKQKQRAMPIMPRGAAQAAPSRSAPAADGPKRVLSYRHTGKRVNNPEVGMVRPENDPDQPRTMWRSDPHLDSF